jgi:hypothetical protein
LFGIGLGSAIVNLAKRIDWNITVSMVGSLLLGSWIVSLSWSWVVIRFWQVASVYSDYMEEVGHKIQDPYGSVWGILIAVAIWVGLLTGSAATLMVRSCLKKGLPQSFVLQLLGTVSVLTFSLTIAEKSEAMISLVRLISIGSTVGLVLALFIPIHRFRQQISAYRLRARSLIKS